MKFLQLFPGYEEYVRDFYARHPGIGARPYREQNAQLRDDGFGIVHMFARYLGPLGFESDLVFTECEPTQKQWLLEHGGQLANPDDWRHEIAAMQVNALRPDVLYVTEPVYYDRRFLARLTHRPRLVMGWKAAAIPAGTDWHGYDLMLSNFKLTFEVGPKIGAKKVEHLTPGFPETLADELPAEGKSWDATFLGSISSEHLRRNAYLEELTQSALVREQRCTLGYFLRTAEPAIVPPGVARHNLGPRWGREMHRILKGSRVALNVGIDYARGETGNMRMLEATGLGSFLLTEHQDNIRRYFEPGMEVETFSSAGELEEKLRHFLSHEAEREAIARRGQLRCRRDFSMGRSLRRLAELIHANVH
ncbi:MAG TPA: glycosyltransferase [Opitutaceae bacterium]|nr:glycosyltransferase [Opitutaceae bacterium]